MNYLAHSYLSFSTEQMVGQFLNDFIPNKNRFLYGEKILQGIILHREIDSFTDAHPEISAAKKVFAPLVRLYSGAFVDVAFDFFLAHHLDQKILEKHSQKVYAALRKHAHILPPALKNMAQRMEKDNWLLNYRQENGIKFSMQNILYKAKYLDKNIPVFEEFLRSKETLGRHFSAFWPDLELYAKSINAEFQNA